MSKYICPNCGIPTDSREHCYTPTEPIYCPMGCGETLCSDRITIEHWMEFIEGCDEEITFSRNNAVTSKCVVCGFQLIYEITPPKKRSESKSV